MPAADVFGSLPTNERFAIDRPIDVGSPRVLGLRLERAPLRSVVWRSAFWIAAVAGYLTGLLADRIRGLDDPRRRGQRLRAMFQSIGGTAITLGLHIATRSDILPVEVCDELSQLEEHGPTPAIGEALQQIERSLGRPIASVFDRFDPTPIACLVTTTVYQALIDGDRVIVQVRRPGISRALDAEIRAISSILAVLEWLTIFPPGRLTSLRQDLRKMIIEEHDFQKRARRQSVFRLRTRKARLRKTSAPRVLRELVAEDVLVNEFAAGYFLSEIVSAVESDDREALARFATEGIDPKRVGRRILHAFWWSLYEDDFFYSDPHPSNIVVQPGGKILFLDFASCGSIPIRLRQSHHRVHHLLWQSKASEAASLMIQTLLPLPHVDSQEMTKTLESRLWTHCQAMNLKESALWQRTTSGAWLTMIEVAREFGVLLRLDVLRMIHSTLLYNRLAARLLTGVDRGLFDDYEKAAFRRLKRRVVKASCSERFDPIARFDRATENLERARFFMEGAIAEVPEQLQLMSSKGAYVANVILGGISRILVVVTLAATILGLPYLATHGTIDPIDLLRKTLTSRFVLALLVVIGLVTARLIHFRLADVDP